MTPGGFQTNDYDQFVRRTPPPPVSLEGYVVPQQTSRQAFWDKFGSGLKNIGKGAVNIVKEMGCTVIDVGLGGITFGSNLIGQPIVFDAWSKSLGALENGNLSGGQYCHDILRNFISLGVYSQEQAFYAWWRGEITDEEMQQVVGGNLVA